VSEPRLEQVVRDTAPIGELLGRAFCDNPGMRATLGEDRPQRLGRAIRLMKGLVASTARAGRVEVVRVDGRAVAASLSHAPGEVPRGLALAPAAVAVLGMGPTVARRLLRLERFLRTHHMRAPHYFLAILGVEPAMQGRGFSSLLLRALGQRADAAGLPCYLETDQEKNVRIYERHGFQVTSEHVLTELSGVKFWLMQRPASR
jgi:GNAT superfamily N-acetyltransferase